MSQFTQAPPIPGAGVGAVGASQSPFAGPVVAQAPTLAQLNAGAPQPFGTLAVTSDGNVAVSNGTVFTVAGSQTFQKGPLPKYNSLLIYGDSVSSLTIAQGATTVANMWANRLSVSLGLTPKLGGLSGAFVGAFWGSDGGNYLSDTPITSQTLCAGLLGINNLNNNGPLSTSPEGAYYLTDYAIDCYAMLAWIATPDTNRVPTVLAGQSVVNPAVTLTGAWTEGNNFPVGSRAIYTTSTGATATFNVTGDTVRVFSSRASSGGTNTWSVTIDGVLQGSRSGAFQYSGYKNSTNTQFTAACASYGGLSNTAHVVVVTCNGPSVAQLLYGVTGTSVAAPSGVSVLAGGTLRLNASAYATGAVNNPAGGTAPQVALLGDAAIFTGNQVLRSVCSQLQSEGMAVFYVDVNSNYDLATQQSADGIHPNDYGHLQIMNKILQSIASHQ